MNIYLTEVGKVRQDHQEISESMRGTEEQIQCQLSASVDMHRDFLDRMYLSNVEVPHMKL